MKTDAKQIGERIKKRRIDLNLSMPELARRLGVNKSTVQRYETFGVDPKRSMVIKGLSEVLLTTEEWLLGMSDEVECSTYTENKQLIMEHVFKYLDCLTSEVGNDCHQQLLTTFLVYFIDLFSVYCRYFGTARRMYEEVMVALDLNRPGSANSFYGRLIEQSVINNITKAPISDMIHFVEGMYNVWDHGPSKQDIGDLFKLVRNAEAKVNENIREAERIDIDYFVNNILPR